MCKKSYFKIIPFLTIPFLIISCGSKNNDYSDHRGEAYITAIEDYVKPQMKYPDKTDFDTNPIYSDYLATDSTYNIGGKGTTINGFGLEVPISFKCRLKYLGGDDLDSNSWKLVNEVEFTQ